MANVYSDSLLLEHGLATGAVASPPAGTLWVVRDVWVYWNPSTALSTDFHMLGDISQTIWFWQFTVVAGNRVAFWQGRQVIKEELGVTVSGDPLDVSISGYVLTLP